MSEDNQKRLDILKWTAVEFSAAAILGFGIALVIHRVVKYAR